MIALLFLVTVGVAAVLWMEFRVSNKLFFVAILCAAWVALVLSSIACVPSLVCR